MQPTSKPLSFIPFTAWDRNPVTAATAAASKAARWQNDQSRNFITIMVSESQAAYAEKFAHTYTLIGYDASGVLVETGLTEPELLEQLDRLPEVSSVRRDMAARGLAVN